MPLLPFRIEFSERAIADLQRRLDATRWPAIPFATGWSAGTDDRVLRDLVRYWRTEFDWFEVQARLNRLAHLRGPIGDAAGELHCVLFAGEGAAARPPLLLLHGWPGSFLELLPAADLLAGGVGGGPAFEVVVPSLPGYGFSDAPPAPGMHPGRIAERMHALMRELGYERYGVQGGDWGAIVATRLARLHPETVVALHLNFPARLPAAAGRGRAERRGARVAEQRRDVAAAGERVQRRAGHEAARRSRTRSWIRRWGCWRGSSRSSGRGATTARTSGRRSGATTCSRT